MADVALKFCQNHLKSLDKLWYYTCLFAPLRIRAHSFALHAFSAEIAGTRARISEPMPGEIRLQWWRDVLEGQRAGEAQANPLSKAVLAMLEDTGLGAGPLIRLIEARRFDLYNDPMGSQNQYEGYAGETQAILFQYMGLMLVPGAGSSLSTAAGHAGVALSLVRHMGDFVVSTVKGQIFLPTQIIGTSGVYADKILQEPLAFTPQILQKANQYARLHLAKAKIAVQFLDQPLKQVFAILNVVEAQLASYQRAQFEPEKMRTLSDFAILWRLLTA